MQTNQLNNVLRPSSFKCTSYGELTFYGKSEKELSLKDYKELKSQDNDIYNSLIYIWIDKTSMVSNTSKIIMQFLFDLEMYQKTSKVFVQWRIDEEDEKTKQSFRAFQNLFPHISFIVQYK
jgi:hypothetical protein